MISKKKLETLRELALDPDMWSVITALRGPDFPSERDNMTAEERNLAYRARRDRKYKTGEVIRGASVGQVGGARTRISDHVTLPPANKWDHYDKHVAQAAKVLGLKVEYEESEKPPVKKELKLGDAEELKKEATKSTEAAQRAGQAALEAAGFIYIDGYVVAPNNLTGEEDLSRLLSLANTDTVWSIRLWDNKLMLWKRNTYTGWERLQQLQLSATDLEEWKNYDPHLPN